MVGSSFRGRRVVAALVVFVPTLFMLWPGMSVRDRLPEQTPTHFGFGAEADAWTDSGTYWLAITLVALAFGFLALAATFVTSSTVRVLALSMLGFLSGLLAAIWFVSAWAALDAGSPGNEEVGGRVFLAIGAGLAWGAITYLVAGRPPREAPAHGVVVDADAPGQALSASVRSGLFEGIAWFTLLLGVGIAIPMTLGGEGVAGAVLGGVLVLCGLLALSLARVTIRVDSRGFRLDSWLRVPLTVIPTSRIASVRTGDLSPADWGGWGWRWLPGQTAYITGGGPGLIIERKNGTWFAITVAGPEPIAEALAGYVAQGRGGGPT